MNAVISEESATNRTKTANAATERTVVVTGGNSGLGYECAKTLAEAGGWHVLIASRDDERNTQAVTRIVEATGNKQVSAMRLDLASLKQIREFARKLEESGLPPVRAVVCNAGVQVVSGVTRTEDNFETTFGVNHLGHFLLVNLLLPRMKAPARVVVVSSGVHDPAQWTGMPAPRYHNAKAAAYPETDVAAAARDDVSTAGRRAYATSKLCNVLFAYELSRRLQAEQVDNAQPAVTVNSFDPGLMPGSGLARDYGTAMRLVWNYMLPALRLFVPNVNSLEKSGKALAALVTDPALEQVTGRYFVGSRQAASSKESHDEAKARELWETSAELVELTPRETTPLFRKLRTSPEVLTVR